MVVDFVVAAVVVAACWMVVVLLLFPVSCLVGVPSSLVADTVCLPSAVPRHSFFVAAVVAAAGVFLLPV